MTHGFGLGETRQPDRPVSLEPAEAFRTRFHGRKVNPGRIRAPDLEYQGFLVVETAISSECRDIARRAGTSWLGWTAL
jgi:hypothetical protein